MKDKEGDGEGDEQELEERDDVGNQSMYTKQRDQTSDFRDKEKQKEKEGVQEKSGIENHIEMVNMDLCSETNDNQKQKIIPTTEYKIV